jgi:hypothetical protein
MFFCYTVCMFMCASTTVMTFFSDIKNNKIGPIWTDQAEELSVDLISHTYSLTLNLAVS